MCEVSYKNLTEEDWRNLEKSIDSGTDKVWRGSPGHESFIHIKRFYLGKDRHITIAHSAFCSWLDMYFGIPFKEIPLHLGKSKNHGFYGILLFRLKKGI